MGEKRISYKYTSILSLYATVLSTTLFVMLPLRESFEVDALPGCRARARAFKELCGVLKDIYRKSEEI